MDHCIFCKIIRGESPSEKLYQDEQITAFRDIQPMAPVHILIVPNRHIDSVNALTEADEALVGRLFVIARQLAQEAGIDQAGYRLIANTGRDGGQSVFHLHLHLLGGRKMRFVVG